MYHGDGRGIVLILKISKKCTKLSHQEHALIYDGPAGKRGYIGIHVALFKFPTDHIESAVEFQIRHAFAAPGEKCLTDHRHALQSLLSQHLRCRGDLSPGQNRETFLCCNGLKHFPGPA